MITQIEAMIKENETRRKEMSGNIKTCLLKANTIKAVYGKKLFAKLLLPGVEKLVQKAYEDFKKFEAKQAIIMKAMDEMVVTLNQRLPK